MLLSKKNLSPERVKSLVAFSKNISIKFSNLNLLELAFTHRSVASDGKTPKHLNNERLEFLGDSVLGMATASYLYEHFIDNPEGDLAKIKSFVVSEQALGPIALKIGIDKLLIMGKGEEMSGGRHKRAILADAVEAVIGAYYIDSGYRAAEKLVLSFMIPEIEKFISTEGTRDYKSMLQEAHQKKYKTCPTYELVKETGPDHDRTFWVAVHLKNATYGPESGKNKKEAEQNVAKKAWQELMQNSNGRI